MTRATFPTKLSDLPLEVWLLITDYLQPTEVFSLMMINKTIYFKLSSNYIWGHIVHQKWFRNCYSSRVAPVPTQKADGGKGYLHYFGYRQRLDDQVLKLIDLIGYRGGGIGDDELRSKIIPVINEISENPDLYVPNLIKLSQHLNESMKVNNAYYDQKNVIDHLRKRQLKQNMKSIYVASSLLESIRFFKLFDTIYEAIMNDTYPKNLENLLLSLNLIDPHYFDLLSIRERVIKTVISGFKTIDINNNTYTSTQKLLCLINLLRETLKKESMVSTDIEPEEFNKEPFFEDLLILRCYAGDSEGCQFVFIAMLENIIQNEELKGKFNIRITKRCIINYDPVLANGKAYIFFDRHGLEIKTDKHVPMMYKNIPTSKQLMKDFLNEWVEMTFESRKFNYSIREKSTSCFHPFVSSGGDSGDKNTSHRSVISRPVDNNSRERLTGQIIGLNYPNSIDRGSILLFSDLISSFWYAATSPFELKENSSNFIEWLNYYNLPFLLIMCNKFFHLKNRKFILDEFNDALENKINFNNITIDAPNMVSRDELYDQSSLMKFSKGEVIEFNGKYHIIVGFLKEGVSEYSLCFDDQGDLAVSRLVNRDSDYLKIIDDSDEIIRRFGFYDQLGEFFTHFDSDKGRFV